MRQKINFNGGWQFHLGELKNFFKSYAKSGIVGDASNLTRAENMTVSVPEYIKIISGEDAGFQLLNIPAALEGDWREVSLPHDWEIRQEYVCAKNKTELFEQEEASGFLPKGVGYYRKRFSVPAETPGQRVLLELEGVMRDCSVWLNGSYVGGHFSGYTGFAIDITEYLRYGDEGENVVLVKTDTRITEGWWSEGAGIYRDVWLCFLSPVHLKRHSPFVYTKNLHPDFAEIAVEALLQNSGEKPAEVCVRSSVLSGGGAVLVMEGRAAVAPLSEQRLVMTGNVPSPALWSLEEPFLYLLKTEVFVNGLAVDCSTLDFGIRTATYQKDGFYLNGKLTELKGVCEHQDFACVGIALTKDVIDYKIKRIKEMGANAYRSAHHPASPALLDACDRAGVLVLNENRRLEVNENGLSDLRELLEGARNHPCVFMYCLENEEVIAPTPMGRRLLRRLLAHAKNLDSTRQYTIAGSFAKSDKEYMRICDVAGYNYDYHDAEELLAEYPDTLIMSCESASFASTRGVYRDDVPQSHCTCMDDGSYYIKLLKMAGTEVDSGTLGGAVGTMAEGGRLDFSWPHYKNDMPGLGGLFVWSAFDYRGETFPWYYPAVSSQYGAMDMCGFAKDAYYYWQSVWLSAPMVHVLPHWSLPGEAGKIIPLEVYSSCDEVELAANGCSLGRRKHTRGKITRYEALYQPGELVVTGYINGAIAAEKRLQTAGEPCEIHLELMYRGESQAFIRAEIQDRNHRLCPTANLQLAFTAEGATVIGVGNGNPSCHQPDFGSTNSTFNGLALALVQIDGGVPIIRASSEALIATTELRLEGRQSTATNSR